MGLSALKHHGLISIAALAVTIGGSAQLAAAYQPATQADAPGPEVVDAPDEGPISATITGVEGNAGVRILGTEQWLRAEVGMKLNEGDEVRTSHKSAVRFVIPPDQTITLDRLGTVQLLKSNFADGKYNTDIGMKYGRTRYDIEAAGREHDARVRSPSSVLAIRGTKVMLFDQPPFVPEAQSLTGRAFFRDARKQVSVGARNGNKVKVSSDKEDAAQTALAGGVINPRGSDSALTPADNRFGFSPAVFARLQEQGGVFEIIGQANNQSIIDSLSFIGTVAGEQPQFNFSFIGSPSANVNLSILTPAGDTITVANGFDNRSPSGGLYLLDINADTLGQGGVDDVVYDDPDFPGPRGVYTITSTLVSGTNATGQLIVLTDRLSSTPGQFGPRTQTLTTENPTATIQVNLTDSDVNQIQRLSRTQGAKRKR
ncbi:MAG TPA: hypothetical protein PLD59_09430 [Tepidisphaeraceae bacterium]|nr:hypothetical protein [Tepidisphaeraceae bacterium]